ncbi:hypothetical protein ACFE04_008108 [Oxalis oulophora]
MHIRKLPNHYQLDIECKRNGEDKVYSLKEFGETYKFGFHGNFNGDKKYNCDLWYSSDHQHHVNFDGFISETNFVLMCVDETECTWTATTEGIYFTNDQKKEDELWYTWDG